MLRFASLCLSLVAVVACDSASAQRVPFSQQSPTGQIGGTFAVANPTLRGAMQAVAWDVPGDSSVGVYDNGSLVGVAGETQPVGLEVGHVHRFRLTYRTELVDRELFPTVELIDRLHPPAGRDAEFPVVLELTEADIEDYLNGQMVTKVIYVQPRNANYLDPVLTRLPTTRVPLDANVMKEAVLRGRPIAVVRLGGRLPMLGEADAAFFGTGGRVAVPVPPEGFLNTEARTVCDPCGRPERTGPEIYPDEYLCDGGDTGVASTGPVTSPLDLDFEETIGTHIDINGRLKSIPSTRVCLYAPAFGAVSVGMGGRVDTQVVKAIGAQDRRVSVGVGLVVPPLASEQTSSGEGLRMRERLSGLLSEQSDEVAAVVVSADVEKQVVGSFSDFGFLSPFLQSQTGYAIIGERIAAAIEYSETRTPVISALNERLDSVIGNVVTGSMTHYEDRRPEGNLVLAKLADKSGANVGEVVTFTIRYDNLGGRPLRQVTISDHLSPRLEYIPDSAKSSRPATIVVEDDRVGSVLLQITLDEPLPAKTGGTVTFRTRVR